MGVYISDKYMQMPKTCGKCKLKSAIECEKWRHIRSLALDRHKDCPLIDIPTKHGRLIDADILYESCALDTNTNIMASAKCINEYMQLKIDGAFTIIPAEGFKEEIQNGSNV